MCTKDNKERLRFTIYDDLILLNQVNLYNPYRNPTKWNFIVDNVILTTTKQYSLRSLKDHVKHLLMLYIKNDDANLKKYRITFKVNNL